jgi:CRP-like cAMP-binding protein
VVEVSFLKKYSLFGGLMDDQIREILPLMEKETYKPDDEIITEGTPNDKIRFILEGRVEIEKVGVTILEYGEGETFGEMEVLDVMPSAATIKALTGTTVLSISNKGLHEIYKRNITAFSILIMNLARGLSRNIRHMNDLLVELTKKTPD